MSSKRFVLIVILIPILCFSLVEIYILMNKNKLKLTKAIVESRDSTIKCLIVGDSHPEAAFMQELNECTNFALGGTTIPMNIDIINSINKNNHLDTVIWSIDPHNFSSYRLKEYSPLFKGISLNKGLIYSPLLNSPIIREEAKDYLFKTFKKKKHNQSLADKTKEAREKSLRKRLKKHTKIQDYQNTDYAKLYKDMVDYLIKKGIVVYLVRAPVIEEYNKSILNYIGEESWRKFIEYLTNTGAIYVDYKELHFDDSNMNYFANQDHLNESGAKVFSSLFRNHYFK